MSEKLDNKKMSSQDRDTLDSAIAEMKERLDQRHPIERKVKFFLDVRGYLKLNAIKGNYIEFGSFRSWTQYAAFKVLEETQMIDGYVGLDAFIGEPSPTTDEALHMPVMAAGDFLCPYEEVLNFVESSFNGKGHIIRGDFREANILKEAEVYTPISLAVVDCNLVSSLEASTRFVMENAVPGCVIFIDDYYTNFGQGQAVVADMCSRLAADTGWRLIDHSFYPPFAKSFILAR